MATGVGSRPTSPQTVLGEVAELLGVGPEAVDPQADLIASGLDSIRMMSLSGRWRKQGIDIGFAELASNPTLAAWTDLVAKHSAVDPATEAAAEPDQLAQNAAGNEPFPLAPIQHALWIGRNSEQELGGVAAHLYVEFDGAAVEPDRLRVAAAKLAARHPMLRVEILPDGTQRISDRELPVIVDDLRELDIAAAEDRMLRTRDAKSHQMLHGEMLELALTLLPDGRTRLHVDMDMQAADAVSYRNFMADLAEFYRGADLPELGYTYRQYREAFTASNPTSEADRRWWAERIADLPEPPALPLVPRSEQANPRRNTRRWHFVDSATRDALFAAAQRRGITPAMAVAASYAGTLARWSAGSRFLLNVPMFGREPYHPDVEKLVGDFTTSLMLDIDLTDARSAAARAAVVQDALHETAAHSTYSGLSVLRDLTRHRGTPTLAPFVFTSALGLGDLFAGEVTEQFGTPVWHISQGPQVLLDAQVTPFDGGLLMNWDVREEAFRPGVIDAMFAYHLAELGRLAADESAWDAIDPPAVSASSRQIRADLNSVTVPASGDALHDGFFRAAAAYPEAPAVFSSLGDLSYGQLAEQVRAVSATLTARGVRPGDVVAVLGPKNAEQIPALLGIAAVGAAYLPIGVDQPADRASRILATAGVHCALVTGADIGALPVPALRVRDAIRDGLPSSGQIKPATTDPSDLAYILFTSGSTGEPKGVEVTHSAAMNTVEFINRHFAIGPADRCLALSTLEGDLSVLDIFGTLRAGAAIVVVDEDQRRDPDSWARLIDAHRVSVLHFMPGWLEMLLEVNSGAAKNRLSSVRVVPTGGDWVRTEMVRQLRKSAPGVRFAGLGGATETAIHNTICEPDELPPHWTAVPFGRPLPNNACRVVAADGTDCPDWVPGELWVSGHGIARGYRGRPDLTAQRFVSYDDRTWYRTGDLVRYLPDGMCEFVGRTDHRVKISGYRIELGEVESALSRIAGVDGAVAAALTDGPHNGASAQLAAIVRANDSGLTIEQITSRMAGFVPPHMVPSHLMLVDHIPFTVGGKINRRVVAELLTASVGARADTQAAGRHADTRRSSPLEQALAHIIAEVLGRDCVDVDDDFFALGGDSVLATHTVGRIRNWLDAPRLMVADIFGAHTPAALAVLLIEQEAGGARLQQVAELYLEVADVAVDDLASELDSTSATAT